MPGLGFSKTESPVFSGDTIFVNSDRKSGTAVNGLSPPLDLEIYGNAIIFG